MPRGPLPPALIRCGAALVLLLAATLCPCLPEAADAPASSHKQHFLQTLEAIKAAFNKGDEDETRRLLGEAVRLLDEQRFGRFQALLPEPLPGFRRRGAPVNPVAEQTTLQQALGLTARQEYDGPEQDAYVVTFNLHPDGPAIRGFKLALQQPDLFVKGTQVGDLNGTAVLEYAAEDVAQISFLVGDRVIVTVESASVEMVLLRQVVRSIKTAALASFR